ncbi:MAG TPA: tRNA pseudouridine(55) synthase TruB, partial [Chroococcidiopsis sp.]
SPYLIPARLAKSGDNGKRRCFDRTGTEFIVDGFLNLNKPAGLTSHDCVAKVRRLLKLKRVGHGGTLDPAATGVLPIAVGRATRLLQYLPEGKAYRATVRFGVRTATDDLEGEVLERSPAPGLELGAIQAVLDQFCGTLQQVPPSYSAIQVGGKRLYQLARAGAAVDVPVRTVVVDHIEVLGWRSQDYPELDLAIACGPGTYIRAIARDLGDLLGVGGTLAALTRTTSCGFHLADSFTLEELAAAVEQGRFQPIRPELGVAHLRAIALDEALTFRWVRGQRMIVPASTGAIGEICRVHRDSGEFLGIGELQQDAEGLAENGEDAEPANLAETPEPAEPAKTEQVLLRVKLGFVDAVDQKAEGN